MVGRGNVGEQEKCFKEIAYGWRQKETEVQENKLWKPVRTIPILQQCKAIYIHQKLYLNCEFLSFPAYQYTYGAASSAMHVGTLLTFLQNSVMLDYDVRLGVLDVF